MFWTTRLARRDTRRRTTRPRRPHRPPVLERLEDRTLPSLTPFGPGPVIVPPGDAAAQSASPAPGQPDASQAAAGSFGAGGVVITPFTGSLNDSARSVLAQPDGKVVAVGSSDNEFSLARYTAAGQLDPTFGTGGRVATPFPGNYAGVSSAALQADGKVLVSGYNYNPNTGVESWVLTRYTAAGAVDPSFGNKGMITTLAGTNEFGNYVTTLPNGEIAVAGANDDFRTSTSTFVVEEYTAAGTLDTSFGTGGRATLALGAYGIPSGIAAEGNNLVEGGYTYDFHTGKVTFVAARFTPAGPDPTFGSGGLASLSLGANGYARGVAVGPDGSVVVAGNVYRSTPTFHAAAAAARFTSAGQVDTTFGSGGLASDDSLSANAVAVQPDGKVVLAGSAGGFESPSFALARLTTAGGPDDSFGSGGLVTTAIADGASANAVALAPGGIIVAAGYAFSPATGDDFAVAGYTPSGGPVSVFGNGGSVTTDFVGQVSASAHRIVQDQQGNLLVGGSTTSAGASLSVARYRPDGTLDGTFGSGGRVQVTFNPFIFGPLLGDGSIAVQPDGKILLVGTSVEPGTTNYDFALARLLPDGQLDPTFGDGGKVTTYSGAQFTDMSPSGGMVLQPDGKILVSGYREYYGAYPYVDQSVVIRYNPDGSLDTSFGSGGRATFALPQGFDRGSSLALAADGKVVIGGFVTDPVTFFEDYFLERVGPDGTPDSTFGSGGQIITPFSGSFDQGGPLAIRPDGRILVGGTTFDPVTFQASMSVAQFTAGGAVDTSFGAGGQASVAFAGDPNFDFGLLGGMSLQADGKVVVAGTWYTFDPVTSVSSGYVAVSRFTAGGSADPSFAGGSMVTTGQAGSTAEAFGVTVKGDGRIVTAGDVFDPKALVDDYALVEYNPDGSLAGTPAPAGPPQGAGGVNSPAPTTGAPAAGFAAVPAASSAAYVPESLPPEGVPEAAFVCGTPAATGSLPAGTAAPADGNSDPVALLNDYALMGYNPDGILGWRHKYGQP
jgi:uncharacterized delta-60 repeat protein